MLDEITQKDYLIAEATDLLNRRVVDSVEKAIEIVCARLGDEVPSQFVIDTAVRHLKADFGVDETEEWLREHDPAYPWTSISWRR